MHTCTILHMYILTHVNAYMYNLTHVHTYTCKCIHVQSYTCTYLHVHTYTCIYLHVYNLKHEHTYSAGMLTSSYSRIKDASWIGIALQIILSL